MVIDLFGKRSGEADELGAVEVDFVHVDSGDLMVVIGSVVANATVEIIARGIDGVLVFIIAEIATPALLVDGM